MVCQMENGSVLSDNSCHSKYRPDNNRTCEMEKCQKNAEWKITAWQPVCIRCIRFDSIFIIFLYILGE